MALGVGQAVPDIFWVLVRHSLTYDLPRFAHEGIFLELVLEIPLLDRAWFSRGFQQFQQLG